MKLPHVYLSVGLLFAILVIAILYPVFRKSPDDPQWRHEANRFAHNIGIAIKQYTSRNNGRLPSTLNELYSEYTKDARVMQDVGVFAGKRLLISYHKSAKLGDRESVVMELHVSRKQITSGLFRPVCLFGDLHVTSSM